MIHGDANYVFHDTVGIVHYANDDALEMALKVGQNNPQAEVFIFHDKPLRHTLFLFKQHDGEFFYYRNGELSVTQSYWRDEGISRFSVHAALYNKYRSSSRGNNGSEPTSEPTRMFLYFGHEIPDSPGFQYDGSYSDSTLTIEKFSHELGSFLYKTTDRTDTSLVSAKIRFDLLLLSTCNNGTPHSVFALSHYARRIIASPTNLHLSYLDIAPFEHLEQHIRENDLGVFAENAALHAFSKLTASVQTVVSVVVYDSDRVGQYVSSVAPTYNKSLSRIEAAPDVLFTRCDCGDIPMYQLPNMNDGVVVYYRPPVFGRDSNKLHHSGWSCWTKE